MTVPKSTFKLVYNFKQPKQTTWYLLLTSWKSWIVQGSIQHTQWTTIAMAYEGQCHIQGWLKALNKICVIKCVICYRAGTPIFYTNKFSWGDKTTSTKTLYFLISYKFIGFQWSHLWQRDFEQVWKVTGMCDNIHIFNLAINCASLWT